MEKKKRTYLIIGTLLFLVLVIGATYAYFVITSVNNATGTKITGTGENLGTPTLTTGEDTLSLHLTYDLVQANLTNEIFATLDGIAVVGTDRKVDTYESDMEIGNGRYILATASLGDADVSYNCDYSFEVSATIENEITDSSLHTVYVEVNDPNGKLYRYSLYNLQDSPKSFEGTIKLNSGDSKDFTIESYVYISSFPDQQDLVGNTFTFEVTPKSGTEGFNCSIAKEPVVTGFAKQLIDSEKMIETGLEGDGYRFVGPITGEFCIYDNGAYYLSAEDGSCPQLVTREAIDQVSGEVVATQKYKNATCPEDNDTYRYNCTFYDGNIEIDYLKNYVCFGTTNKDECTSEPEKYMYRIVGVFSDAYGDQHVKLLKYKSIGQHQFNNENDSFIVLQDSDLYKGLNGSYFLTNETYDYLQNNVWLNKIANWTWNNTFEHNYHHTDAINGGREEPMSYSTTSGRDIVKYIYLHEQNLTGKLYRSGYFDTANSKIGLLYFSDFWLAIPYTGLTNYEDIDKLNNWILDNDLRNGDYHEWIYSMNFLDSGDQRNYFISYWAPTEYFPDASVGSNSNSLNEALNVRPAFYLNSNVESSSGTGTIDDPYMITE